MSRIVIGFLAGCIPLMVISSVFGQDPEARAGGPKRVAWWAAPSRTPAYAGGYVGGGNAYKGESRMTNEGTWGWDYEGRFVSRRVFLSWSHGRRYQGGTGAYRTDGGPKVPDVPGAVSSSLIRAR
jgi:hypothetical protein